jgi:transcriptional regulator
MTENERRDLFPGALEMMVLQTLRRGPLHGYAIAQTIRQTSGDLLRIEEGTLYPALQRLLREGWVDAGWGVSSRNRKVRIYRITAAGRKQLERERAAFDRMHAGISRVMRPAES